MNPKRQRFCEEYAVDLNGAQAAIRAGYAPGCAKVTASRLLTDANVRERVDRLIVKHRERLEVDIDSLTEMFVEDRQLAHENKQAGAAVSASEKLGKLHGYMSERLKVDVNVTIGQMSDAELDAEFDENDREMVCIEGRPWIEAKIARYKCLLDEYDSGEFGAPVPFRAALPAPAVRNPLPEG